MKIPTLPVFQPLLAKRRFKGAAGGRGGGKSHFVAEKLIADTVADHHRVACIREFQSSIKDSVKTLLEDKIKKFELGHLFHSTNSEIRGPNDSLFVFKGMQATESNKFAEALKSLEGFSRAWAEEAQTLSATSLEIMTPTFRSPGAEMYFTWNPRKKDDPVDVFFHENEGDPDFAFVHCIYRDNPWLPDDAWRDMNRDKKRNPDRYAHVWLGLYEQRSQARVFHNWKIDKFETPLDTQFYFGADWGFGDPTVLIRCWIRDATTLMVDFEAFKRGCPTVKIPALFATVPGATKWTIRADSARPDTIDHVKNHGFPLIIGADKGRNSVEDGIEFLQGYDIVVHERCENLIDELSSYSYKTDPRTNDILPFLDKQAGKDHCIDALRYALEAFRKNRGFDISDKFLQKASHPLPSGAVVSSAKTAASGYFGDQISDAFLAAARKR